MSAAAVDPRFEMLVKLLQMTTSDNDNEALLAMRKANNLVRQHFGGDWESLLRKQVKIIADPFFNLDPLPTQSTKPQGRGVVPPKPKRYSSIGDLA